MNSFELKTIMEKSSELTEQVLKTNESYKSMILEINNITMKEMISTLGSLFKKDNEIVKTIVPTKYENINSNLSDTYVFIGNFTYSQNYLLAHNNNVKVNGKYFGKWMLFGTPDEMLNYWKLIRQNTYLNNLGFFSKFIGDEKSRVICIYFEDYRNKENIIMYGNKIKELVDYKLPMYFKTDKMTKKSIHGLGSWKYMIPGDTYEFT